MLKHLIYFFDLLFFGFSNILKLKKTFKSKYDIFLYLLPSFATSFIFFILVSIYIIDIIDKYQILANNFMIILLVFGLIFWFFCFILVFFYYIFLIDYKTETYSIVEIIKKAKFIKNKKIQASFIDYLIKEFEEHYKYFSSNVKLENIRVNDCTFGLDFYRDILIELNNLSYKYEKNKLVYLSDKELLIIIKKNKQNLIEEEEKLIRKIYNNNNLDAQKYIQSLKDVELKKMKKKVELETL